MNKLQPIKPNQCSLSIKYKTILEIIINNDYHITHSGTYHLQNRMLLIINNLYSKPHETTGNKPANPENT
jgi:hypothetical protein